MGGKAEATYIQGRVRPTCAKLTLKLARGRYNLLRRRHAPPTPPGDALTPLARLPIGNQDWGGESVDAFAH